MKKQRPGEKVQLLTVDELLGVPNEEATTEIRIDEIDGFNGHPFKVLDDDKMDDLVKSIKLNGILTPVLVRPQPDDRYEMISGHRRLHAAQLVGLEAVPAIVRELDDDDATIIMVDANLQREEILPSEKAFAYRMRYEAVKRKAGRPGKSGKVLNGRTATVAEKNASQNIFPSSAVLPVAYASNDVNATADTARGSMNLTESKALDDGYKFVWEFTPSQGNGTIAAVALTSALGGKNVFGNDVNSSNGYLKIKETRLESQTDDELALLYSAVEVDFENNVMYSIRFVDSSVIVRKLRLPVFSVGLNDRLNDVTCEVLEETTLHCGVFSFMTGYTPYGDFLDGHDGYWYGFSNSPNSSGDATMKWIKIKKSDMTFTEGT